MYIWLIYITKYTNMTVNLTNTLPKRTWWNWVPVVVFMLVAAAIRLLFTASSDYYLLEGDGPYYPLQVRSLIENFKLGYPDVPLIFILEAILAKILQVINFGSPDECIITSIRLLDAILPPLAAIPAFLIGREMQVPHIKSKLLTYIVVGFTVLNITTVFILSQSLHKNALAVVWIFFYLYFIMRMIKYPTKKDFKNALWVLILCALTHFGSFGVLLLITFVFLLFWVFQNKGQLKLISMKTKMIVLTIIISLIAALAFFDLERFYRLLYLPVKLFEAPVFLLLLNGQSAQTNFLILILMNLLTVIALFIIIPIRKKIDMQRKVFAYSLLAVSFFMTSPLLGTEWANRLYMISYIPICALYLLIFTSAPKKWVKIFPSIIFIGLTIISVMTGITQRGFRTISNEAYSELKSLKEQNVFKKKSVIIARQDLRLLASWLYGTKGASDYALTKADFKQYDAVYAIRQIKGSNYPINRQRGEPDLPQDSLLIYKGNYFVVFTVTNTENWNYDVRTTPKLSGTIVFVGNNTIGLKNGWTGNVTTVRLSSETKITLLNENENLKEGMFVEVWGKGKPFSLMVNAQTIIEKKNEGVKQKESS
jgi:hypothetical protein